MNTRILPVAVASAALAGVAAHGQTLFLDTLDAAASANVRFNTAQGLNMSSAFVDYSNFTVGAQTFNVPEAPRSSGLGGASTRGVLMRSTYDGTARILNMLPAAAPNGDAMSFSGNYRLSFDMWLGLDPTATTASAGTTEVGIWGIGNTQSQALGRSFRSSATGTWGWLSVDGGFGATLNSGDASFRVGANQIAILENPTQAANWNAAWPANPDIPGATPVQNAPWNSWTQVDVTAQDGNVSVRFNGVEFFNLASSDTSGFAVIGYEDPFTGSASFSPDYSWGLFDNIQVTVVPEPGTYALMTALGLGGFVAIRRRWFRA